MPPQVIAELEAIFKAPLIEAYGMTEATHQMASNPLPPAVRKPGSGGPGRRPEVAIMGEDGRCCRAASRRDRDPRRQRHRRLREQPQGQCRRLHQRLVPHRRPGRQMDADGYVS
jgi:acyl-coenzyme A synthetase/AMP-(fatty) acid ligase